MLIAFQGSCCIQGSRFDWSRSAKSTGCPTRRLREGASAARTMHWLEQVPRSIPASCSSRHCRHLRSPLSRRWASRIAAPRRRRGLKTAIGIRTRRCLPYCLRYAGCPQHQCCPWGKHYWHVDLGVNRRTFGTKLSVNRWWDMTSLPGKLFVTHPRFCCSNT